jgi:hypothetical protein
VLRTEQEAWRRERAAFVTASRFADVMAFGKTGQPLKERRDYLGEIVTERLTGEPCSMILAPALGWGNDVEPYGKTAYEIATGCVLREPGLLKHPSIPWVAATPDGLVDPDGGYESKCPANSLVHLQTWLDGMPKAHMPQIQGGMWVCERAWWDFVSYDPRMPAHLRLYRQRIQRDDAYIAQLEKHVRQFLAEVDEMLDRIAKLGVSELKRAA